MLVHVRRLTGCMVVILAAVLGAQVSETQPSPAADSASLRRSSWQVGGGGAGTLNGAGWSGVVTYERPVDAARSLVARGELVRVLDRGRRLQIEWSIPEWELEGVDVWETADAWVNAYALSVGGRYVRPGRPAHAFIESSFGPAIEQAREKTHVSALVGVSGGAIIQPARSPVGGFAELRLVVLFSESGILVTGRAGLLLQRP